MSEIPLRRVYAEICRGFSVASYEDRPLYVKHLTVFDQTEIDVLREDAFENALSRGVKTEEAKVAWLTTKGLWAKKDDAEIKMHQDYADALYKTRSKQGIKAQVEQTNKQIREAEDKLDELTSRRARLIGLTAEQVADQKVQYEYMRLSFFKDERLEKPCFTPKDITKLDHQEADSLLYAYIAIINRFAPDTLRRITIAPYFTNSFHLVGERVDTFFGKPIIELTVYQTNLLSYGRYFASLLSQNDVPKEMLNNPDKIEEYVMRSRNMKTALDKVAAGAENVAIFGASKEDFDAMGVKDSTDRVRQDITKNVSSGLQDKKALLGIK